MLDSETKRRIDTARDILVGKVPDPKSQVEQITIALIYKFMDDMDAQTEELGGKRKFFVKEFAPYGWAKLMAPSVSGEERIALYADGMVKMTQNAAIPQLFRNIFKNAYLPYRDPETLKAFLKIIDQFKYDHSERLGDAFEYLLSVLGSQGDAGQFRTPRHIIDFIVKIIDPQKHETVLDPACGTAGFLISAYKHIMTANTSNAGVSPAVGGGVGRLSKLDSPSGILLTPDERKKLAGNFRGYDISPDMVRLSLVNMYLHGFKDPHVYEYDSLTSQDRWNESADVILANPPFMSPKGGIKPHNRFSVPSKRSEVLFVDYIAEHLTPAGRAGIIVPEGIIFQSQTAYKDLRKLLVEQYLVAVISLPAGIFQPYSGVKTSILILDKSLSKHTDTIGFFKIESDGFGLGAQRRAIEKNDLTHAAAEIAEYFHRLRSRQTLDDFAPTLGLIVPKEKIAANGDYNLSGERYGEKHVSTAAWPLVSLGEVTSRLSGGTPSKQNEAFWKGTIPWVSPKDMKFDEIYDAEDHVSDEAVKERSVTLIPPGTLLCVVRSGILKHTLPIAITRREVCFNQDIIALTPDENRLDVRFLFRILQSKNDEILANGIKPGVTVQSFHNGFFKTFQIPLPPLEVQREIVAEIDAYQKVIDGARVVLDHYHPHIPINPDWPMVLIGDVVDFVSGLTVSIPEVESENGTPIIAINNVTEDGHLTLEGLRRIAPPTKTLNYCQKGDLLFNWRNGSKHLVGKTALFDLDGKYLFASFLLGIRAHPKRVDYRYLWHTLNIYRKTGMYVQFMRENVNGLFNREELKITKIPLPPLETQQAIVAEIQAEQRLVQANRELITRMEKKIAATLARIWGDPDANSSATDTPQSLQPAALTT